MYYLENDVEWTSELKNAFKHGITHCQINTKGYLITESNVFVLDNNNQNIIVTGGYDEDNKLLRAELTENRYVPNLGFIGQAVSRKLEVELQSSSYVSNMENEEITFKIGAEYNGNIYYINYGKFIVDKAPENDDTNGKVTFVAYDYMTKFDKNYEPTTSFPTTLGDIFTDICNQCGVEKGTTSFANANFVVENNQYENKTCKDVLRDIAKSTFSWARIGQDNKCYLDFLVQIPVIETITKDDYYVDNFKKANEYFGTTTGIGVVGIGDSDINGSEIYTTLSGGGDGVFTVYDNLFAYDNTKKQSILNGAAGKLLGFKYFPMQEIEMVGLVYLCPGDRVEVQDMESYSYYTYVLNHSIEYNGAVSDSMSSMAESNNETTYKNKNASAISNQRTQVSIDRANEKILLQAQQIEANAQNISLVAEDMSNLTNENYIINSNFATGDYKGWVKRNKSSDLYVQVNGTNRKNWLRVKNTDATSVGYGIKQIIEREISINTNYVLSFLAFYHGDDPSSIIRVGVSYYNNNTLLGSTWKNTNTLTNVPTTKYELKFTTPTNPASPINKIVLELTGADYTTYNYWITEIKFEPGNVATEWCPNVADHIKTMINLSPESAVIQADKISLAGKTIQMTSDNIAINSTNFSVTKDGVITAKSGTIGGIDIKTDGLYYFGSDNWQGFGLWKHGAIAYDDSYLLFHAGANASKLGDAMCRIIENGDVYLKNLYIEGRNAINEKRRLLEITGTYNQPNDQFWSYFTIKMGYFGLIDATGNTDAEILQVATPAHKVYLGDFANGYKAYVVNGYLRWLENSNIKAGRIVAARDGDEQITIYWDNSALHFFVDGVDKGTLSDKRLKKDIHNLEDIDNLLKAIDECKMYHFKADNRGGLISVGVMAQDFLENCKKYGVDDPFVYEVIQKIRYKAEEKEPKYYTINYEQYLLIKTEIQQRKMDKMQNEIDELKAQIKEIKEKLNG